MADSALSWLRDTVYFVWTVEDHLRGKPDAIRTLFESFENLAGEGGLGDAFCYCGCRSL